MTVPVELSGLTKRYGADDAVRDVSLQLGRGECIALIGHNGAGKTTLMKLMLGLIRPTSGTVRVLGQDPADARARGQIGFLPENVAFNPALTGRELLTFYARLKGEPVPASLELLERVGLGEAAGRRVGTYSKGMRQRLGLAQALLGSPRILLLDEPTTGLDPALRQSFYEIVLELRNAGATVLLSSHALTELEERTDRVVIMHKGVMVADGSIEALRSIAELPVRMRVTVGSGTLGAVPNWLGPVDAWQTINGHAIELSCSPDNKMAVLRSIVETGPAISDIEIMPPTLDRLYAHFLRQREAPL